MVHCLLLFLAKLFAKDCILLTQHVSAIHKSWHTCSQTANTMLLKIQRANEVLTDVVCSSDGA